MNPANTLHDTMAGLAEAVLASGCDPDVLAAVGNARLRLQAAIDAQDAVLLEMRRTRHYLEAAVLVATGDPDVVDVRDPLPQHASLVLRAVTETLEPLVGHDLAIRCADEVLLALDREKALR